MAQNNKSEPTKNGPETWESEQIGFPPYWNPTEGKQFFGTVVVEDTRGDFPRFVIRASRETVCQQGPAKESEEVIVKPGEFFTVSNYSALPLTRYMGAEILVTAKTKRGISHGNDLWIWDLKCNPKHKQLVEANAAKSLAEASKLFEQSNSDSSIG